METLFPFFLRPEHPDYYWDTEYFNYTLAQENEVWDISGFDYFVEILPAERQVSIASEDAGFDLTYSTQDLEIQVVVDKVTIYHQDITEIIMQLHRANTGRSTLPTEAMSYRDHRENFEVLYIFKWVSGSENISTGHVTI